MNVKEQCDEIIDRCVAECANLSGVKKLTSGTIDKDYYIRHVIETILRIRLARTADGEAISQLARTNPVAASLWCRYADEEMLHDRMFLSDVKAMGVDADYVYSHDPLVATKMLQGYLYYTLKHEGPLGLLAKAYFLEAFTYRTQKFWNKHIGEQFGPASVRGANAHLTLDGDLDHSGDVWKVVERLLVDEGDEIRVVGHVQTFVRLMEMYFVDLENAVSTDKPTNLAAVAPMQVVAKQADAEYDGFELETVH
ncbi:MAG: hypothetical protein WA790_09475 [Sulfitobacter sp.]